MNPGQKWIGAKLSAENSGDILMVSRLAFDAGKYGAATSLAVLSSEESAKAFGLAMHALAPGANLRPLNRYFKSHKEKHGAAAALTLSSRATQMAHEFLHEITDDPSIPEEKRREIALSRMIKATNEAVASDDPPRIIQEMKDIDAWHQSAESDKQAGFYVANNEGYWYSPAFISMEKARRHIDFAEEMHFGVVSLCSPAVRDSLHEEIRKNMPSIRT